MSQDKQQTVPSGPIPESVSLAGADGAVSVDSFVVAKEPESRLEVLIDRISDFCSSILVKETRQAIKSRQFFLTFMVLLAVVIVWTFFALSPTRDNYEIDSLGAFMLCGFLWILGLPLVLIIPYTTFRSLAQEYEDGTIEMVLITTMKPRQIITGKLGSAMLQVLIYVSVLAPCISFCYLLRGVDISQIWLSLGGGLIVNFGLCCLAIALASASNSRIATQVISVFLILGLLFCAWMWCVLAYVICYEPIAPRERDIYHLMWAGLAIAWISIAILLFFAASAKIAFASSNRSTLLRVGVLVQVALFFAWALAAMAAFGFHKYAFMSASVFSMHYLLLVGSMMVACHAGMSPRIRRTLPTTFVKKSLTGLFFPGPGRAFLYVVGLALGLSSAFAVIAVGHEIFDVGFDSYQNPSFGRNVFSWTDVGMSLWVVLTNFTYFLFYFCIVFLISRLIAKRAKTTRPFVLEMAITSVVVVFLATLSCYTFAPDVFWNNFRDFYPSQVLNWYRAQYHATEGHSAAVIYVLLIGIPTILMFLVCLRISAKELLIASTMVPERVLEEDEQLRRERALGSEADEETIDEIFAAVRPNTD